MSKGGNKGILITLPEEYCDLLSRMVAERLLENPRSRTFRASIAREIICEYLDTKITHKDVVD